jgi:hypothetical protein
MNPQHDEKAGHQAAANLSFATSLSQMLQGQNPQQALQMEQPVEQKPQEDIKGLEDRLMSEISDIKGMIEQSSAKDKNKEVEDLKKQIEEVLNETE